MAWRALTVALVVAAAAADTGGVHQLAFYAVLAAVPAAAVAALESLGGLVESLIQARGETAVPLQAILSVLALALLVLAAASRSAALSDAAVPTLGVTAVVACLAVLCAEALLAGVVELRRRTPAALQPDAG